MAQTANAIQEYLAERTRLGIPAIIHEECLHGLIAWAAPCFQQSIGAAASFDPDIVTDMAATIRRRMLLTGARHALGPVLDIGRDPRWGRIEETYGEDPYLAAELGCAFIEALQGLDLAEGVLATAKHMVGHGLAEGGLNMAPAHVGERELRDEQLFPFEAAVRRSGIASVMPAYCDVDGVPCHASTELLARILRDEWGFDGIVASDYMGVEMLTTAHQLTGDLVEAARLALVAGLDSELPRTAAFGSPLEAGLQSGRIADADLDAAVGRMLRVKFRLGLFDQPYVPIPDAAVLDALAVDEGRAARRLAERSLVLVKNDGILPLPADLRRVAVIGPIADSARDLLGDYSHLVHMQTLREMREGGNALGIVGDADVIEPGDELAGRRTILDAIRASLVGAEVRYARGTGISDGSDEEIAAAVEVARASEVAILVVGERSGLTDDSTTGEFRDRSTLGFHGRQQELLEAVVATGTPVVLVVVSGRPLAIESAAGQCHAVLLAWVPGDAGPDAIADVLTGAVEPGRQAADLGPAACRAGAGLVPAPPDRRPLAAQGRLRRRVGRAALAVRVRAVVHDVQGRRAEPGPRRARDRRRRGHDQRRRHEHRRPCRRRGRPAVRPRRRGHRGAPGPRAARLPPRLLAAGECRTVTFRLSAEQFAYTGADHRRVVEPGTIGIAVGTSSVDLPLTATVTLTGPTDRAPRANALPDRDDRQLVAVGWGASQVAP